MRFLNPRVVVGALLSMATGVALGQVNASSNFDGGPQGWTFDVAARWHASEGNPGGCLENFAEPTNGPAWAFAAPEYLGDWTTLNGRGVLRFDHRRVTNGGGSVLAIVPIIIDIIGPGGTARWESELLPNPGDWRTFVVPIDRVTWNVPSEAAWLSILSNIQTVRISLEQVSNTNEPEDLNRLDNAFLGFLCDSIDFNNDSLSPDSLDLDDFLAVLGGGPSACSTFPTPGCNDIDFNNDGLFPDSLDLEAFLSRLAGGPCV